MAVSQEECDGITAGAEAAILISPAGSVVPEVAPITDNKPVFVSVSGGSIFVVVRGTVREGSATVVIREIGSILVDDRAIFTVGTISVVARGIVTAIFPVGSAVGMRVTIVVLGRISATISFDEVREATTISEDGVRGFAIRGSVIAVVLGRTSVGVCDDEETGSTSVSIVVSVREANLVVRVRTNPQDPYPCATTKEQDPYPCRSSYP